MAFDITKALDGIARPKTGTGKPELREIPLHLIDRNPKNFYSTDGIDALADNIRMFGLMEPLIVRETQDGRYLLISGHRRRLALRKIAEEAENYPESMHEKVACLVQPEGTPLPGIEGGEETEAKARQMADELRLIFANSDTRVMSSADTAQQVRRIRELLTGLRDLGYQLPGKLRDHVAAAAKVSATRVARLDVIDKGLTEPALRKAWKDGTLGETSAYEIARRPADVQKLAAQRVGPKVLAGMTIDRVVACLDACEADGNLEREAVEDWNRNVSGMAEAAGSSVLNDYLEKMLEEDGVLRRLCRENLGKILRDLMAFKDDYDFSENFRVPNIDRMRKHDPHSSYTCGWNANDGSGTWIDWDSKGIRVVTGGREFRKTWTDFYDALTGAALQQAWKSKNDREEDAEPAAVSAADTGAPEWKTGEPDHDGRYFCRVLIGGTTKVTEQRMEWKDGGWRVFGDPAEKYQITVKSWWPLPPEEA